MELVAVPQPALDLKIVSGVYVWILIASAPVAAAASISSSALASLPL
jgi:hypothetical protein